MLSSVAYYDRMRIYVEDVTHDPLRCTIIIDYMQGEQTVLRQRRSEMRLGDYFTLAGKGSLAVRVDEQIRGT